MILFPVHTHCINDTDHFDPSLSCGLTQIISTLNYFLIWTLHFLVDLQIYIMLHQPHPGISRPALLVVVAHDVLVVGIWVLCQVSLNQVPSIVRRKSVKMTNTINLSFQ